MPEATSGEALEPPSADGSSVGGLQLAFRVLLECYAADLQGIFWESDSRRTKSCTFFKEQNHAAVFNPQQRVCLNEQN